MSPSLPGVTAPPKAQQGLHLACRECQRKKIKCDRTYPCGQCNRANLSCVSSTRKPRAKIGLKGDAELRQRIAKLERLVETFQGDGEDGRDHDAGNSLIGQSLDVTARLNSPGTVSEPQNSQSPASSGDTTSTYTSKYVAPSFWSSLTSEVKALADAFEEDQARDGEESTTPETTPGTGALEGLPAVTGQYELIFCPPGALYVMPGALNEPDYKTALPLVENYLEFVDPGQKVCHTPSLRRFLEHEAPYLNRPADAPCNKALRAAIYFAGVNASTSDECVKYFGRSREELALEFRRNVDIALYLTDPLNTNELATLQALTIYIASVRVLDSSRRAWSMIGLVVRIARAMGIHRELPGESVYIAELRRRLWYNILYLDCHAAVDRGSEPAVHPDTFTRQLPLNVNDIDFDEGSTTLVARENELTDISASLVSFEGSVTASHLAAAEESAVGAGWQKRLEMAYAFQRKVTEKYLRHCDPAIIQQRILLASAKAAIGSMILRAVRPIQWNPLTHPPRVDSPWVMQLALNILHHQNEKWDFIHFVRQRRMPWVPWHAMAVALAGICSMEKNALSDEAWSLCQKAMTRYQDEVADTSNGMLWKPIEKLFRKAQAWRDSQERQPQESQTNPPVQASINSFAQTSNPMAWDTAILNQPIATDPMFDPMSALPVADNVFDFPPEMQAALPQDNSWLDWESILRDMDEIKADDNMQWMHS